MGTSGDPNDESNEVEAEGTEDLNPEWLEERILKVGIGRSHQDVGSLHHDEYEGRDDDDGDALLISYSCRRSARTYLEDVTSKED